MLCPNGHLAPGPSFRSRRVRFPETVSSPRPSDFQEIAGNFLVSLKTEESVGSLTQHGLRPRVGARRAGLAAERRRPCGTDHARQMTSSDLLDHRRAACAPRGPRRGERGPLPEGQEGRAEGAPPRGRGQESTRPYSCARAVHTARRRGGCATRGMWSVHAPSPTREHRRCASTQLRCLRHLRIGYTAVPADHPRGPPRWAVGTDRQRDASRAAVSPGPVSVCVAWTLEIGCVCEPLHRRRRGEGVLSLPQSAA